MIAVDATRDSVAMCTSVSLDHPRERGQHAHHRRPRSLASVPCGQLSGTMIGGEKVLQWLRAMRASSGTAHKFRSPAVASCALLDRKV